MRPLTPADLDKFFLQGQISEEEYLHLACEDINIIAVAEDKVDGITTVSLVKEASGYIAEVLYPLEQSELDERFVAHASSLKEACDTFLVRVNALQRRGHEFDVTWYVQRKK